MSISRGREAVRIYTDDKAAMMDAVQEQRGAALGHGADATGAGETESGFHASAHAYRVCSAGLYRAA